MDTIKQQVLKFLQDGPTLTPKEKTTRLTALSKLFQDAAKFSEGKVKVAIDTYDIVEKHVRRLDDDLRKFEDEQMTVPKQPVERKKRPACMSSFE